MYTTRMFALVLLPYLYSQDHTIKPELDCPEKLEVMVDNITMTTLDIIQYLSVSGGEAVVVPSTIDYNHHDIGSARTVHVTATNDDGTESYCSFMVNFLANVCFKEELFIDDNAVRACTDSAGGLICESTCNEGYIYSDGTQSKNFTCTGAGYWSPGATTPHEEYCLAIQYPLLSVEMTVVYQYGGFAVLCQNNEFQTAVDNNLATFKSRISTYCEGMTWDFPEVTASNGETSTTFALVLKLTSEDAGNTALNPLECLNRISNITNNVFNIIGDQLTCQSVAQLVPGSVDVNGDPVLTCANVAYYKTTRIADDTEVCVSIGPGEYYDSDSGNFLECPDGTYQNKLGQSSCKICPGTRYPNAKKIDCQETCPPGFTSTDIFYPCTVCPVDQFWVNKTSCESCKVGWSTVGREAVESEDGCYHHTIKPEQDCPEKLEVMVDNITMTTLNIIQELSVSGGEAAISNVCFKEELFIDDNAVRACTNSVCESTCNEGYIYSDGTPSKNFICTDAGLWSADANKPNEEYCLAIQYPLLSVEMTVVYHYGGFAVLCQNNEFQTAVDNNLATFKSRISTYCEGMTWDFPEVTASNGETSTTFALVLKLTSEDAGNTALNPLECLNRISNITNNVFNIIGDQLTCQSVAQLVPGSVDVNGDPELTCAHVAYYKTTRIADDTEVCVSIGPGEYYDSDSGSFLECPDGTYQDRLGQSSCKTCPGIHYPNAKKIDCQETCPPGFTSTDGFFPCTACPVDQFWVNKTSCESCKVDWSTVGRDAVESEDGCYEPCPLGSYSLSGYMNIVCDHCPEIFYQDEIGQTQCTRCPADSITEAQQSISSDNCTVIEQDCEQGFYHQGSSCEPCDCHGHGIGPCDKQTGVCQCKPGWDGDRCTINVDECLTNNVTCPEGSMCIDHPGYFTCECDPGYKFNGSLCEVCIETHFGQNCSEVCDCEMKNVETTISNRICDIVSGDCICKSGWTGSRCGNVSTSGTTDTSDTQRLIIIVSSAAAGCLLLVVIVTVCVCKCRKPAKNASSSSSKPRNIELNVRNGSHKGPTTTSFEVTEYNTINDSTLAADVKVDTDYDLHPDLLEGSDQFDESMNKEFKDDGYDSAGYLKPRKSNTSVDYDYADGNLRTDDDGYLDLENRKQQSPRADGHLKTDDAGYMHLDLEDGKQQSP